MGSKAAGACSMVKNTVLESKHIKQEVTSKYPIFFHELLPNLLVGIPHRIATKLLLFQCM
jgi:hypothetical protein